MLNYAPEMYPEFSSGVSDYNFLEDRVVSLVQCTMYRDSASPKRVHECSAGIYVCCIRIMIPIT